jgi:hypothetical protein
MKKTVFCVSVLSFVLFGAFVLMPAADAAYRVYLKNGWVISGVASYVKSNGEMKLSYGGGVVSVPRKDVLRIEKYGGTEALPPPAEALPEGAPGEAVSPSAPTEPGPANEARRTELKKELDRIEGRLGEIKKKEDELAEVRKEYDTVRLRIEVLFQQGRKAALQAGKSEAQWFQFLPTKERQWAQMNSIKKNELEAKLESLEKEMEPLRTEKESLLQDKERLQKDLGSLKG